MSENQSFTWPPRGFTGLLVRWFASGDASPRTPDMRIKLGMLEGWTSTVASLLLSSTKLVLGSITGSIAVIADGINNLTDVGSSLVVAFGFRWSRKPRDSDHPFGHGRIETVAALVLSITLIMVGLDVGKESVQRLLNPTAFTAPSWVVGLLALTTLFKEWLALFARKLARATQSKVLEADFWNHQFDVLSNAVVVLALIGSRFGWLSLDGWAGLVVSLFILYTGVRYARQSVSVLLGEGATKDEVMAVEKTAAEVAGVNGVHDILIHKYGDVKIASLHIEVDAEKPSLDVHDLAECVERAVEKATGCKAIVHVDPVDRRHPKYEQAKAFLKQLVAKDSRIVRFHDLRVTGKGVSFDLSVDVVVGINVAEASYDGIAGAVKTSLMEDMKGLQNVIVVIEPAYAEETSC
jgi:cation diffusion facilitator family transporter